MFVALSKPRMISASMKLAQSVLSSAENARTSPTTLWNGIRGIVFDAVGTLIEPVPSVAEAYTAAARRQGVVLDPREVRARFHVHFQSDGVHASRGLLSTDEETERRRWRMIVIGVLPEVAHPDEAFDELWDHFSQPMSWRCFPDVAVALDTLIEQGISVCIGSNFDRRLRCVVNGLPQLRGRAGSLVISSEVGYRKPHPSFFHAACAHLGLPPEAVLCVGDDVENDVRGAIRAGLSGLLLERGAHKPDILPHVPNLTALVQSKLDEL
jgi:putative hydrolase of the HAD superfamily